MITIESTPATNPPAPEITGPPAPVGLLDRKELSVETARQTGGPLDPDSWVIPNGERLTTFLQTEPDQSRIDGFAYEWLQTATEAKASGTGGGIHKEFRTGLKEYADFRRARGEEPFQHLNLAKTRQASRDAREQVPFFRTLFSDPDKMTEAFPPEQRQAFESRFADALDAHAEKKKIAGVMLVSTMTGRPAEEVADLWPQYRSKYGQEHLGLTGKIDDATFYQAAGKAFEQEVADDETVKTIAEKAQQAAIQGKPLASMVADGKALTGDRWKAFEPAARAGYASILSDFSDNEIKQGRAFFEAVADMEGKKVEDLAKGDGQDAAWMIALREYGNADQPTRDRIMSLIGLQAQAEGEDIQNYFERLGAATQSGTNSLTSGISGFTDRMNLSTFEEAAAKATDPEEKRKWENTVAYMKGRGVFSADLQTAGVKVRRYVDDKRSGLWDSLGDYSVMAAESLPVMAVSAIPFGAGIPLVIASASERNMSKLRREAPDAEESTLLATAYTSGAIEAGIERLQFLTLSARLPRLNAALLKWGKPGTVAVAATRAGAVTVLESTQEVIQDLTLPATQEIAAALTAEIPGPNWGKVIADETAALGDIAGVSLMFGLIGGVGSTITDHVQAPRLAQVLQDREGLALAGYSAETIDEVATLAATNPAAAAETLKAAMAETPKEDRQRNSQEARVRLETETAEATNSQQAGLPTMERQEDGKVQVNFPDAPSVLVDDNEQAIEAVRNWDEQAGVDTTKAVREYIDFLSDYHASNPEAVYIGKQTNQDPTLETWAGNSKERIAQANGRIDIMLRQAGTEMGIERPLLSEVPILGASRNIRAGAITRMVSEINKSGSPLTVIEEAAEGIGKWLMADSKVSESKMVGWIRSTEEQTRIKILADDIANMSPEARAQEIAEGFSYIAKNNAIGKIQDSALPSPVKAFFRAFKEQIASVLRIAADFARLRSEGKVDAEFGYWLDVAAGLEPEFQMENLSRQMESELQAEAMQGFTEVQDGLKGMLPHPSTLEAAGDPLAGEVRRLWEGMMENPDNGASKSARTRKVNEFFRPKGESANLDEVRRSLQEQGFDFATPAEMLEAADLSINHGRKQYGTTDGGMDEDVDTWQPTFSIGRSAFTPTKETKVFHGDENSPTVIGPVTFSIEAFHGTPHRVDQFSTEKIGIGEGAQAYGWGLYFAESKDVAKGYRRGLSYKESRKKFLDALPPEADFDEIGELLGTGHFSSQQEKVFAALAADGWLGFDYPSQAISAAFSGNLENWDPSPELVDAVEGSGNLYSVKLDATESDLLDWDKPLSEQSEKVKAALSALEPGMKGSDIVYDVAGKQLRAHGEGFNYNKATSAFLESRGIQGIQFLDGNSRDAGDGTRNYVIFDDSLIKITEENGQPVNMQTFAIALRTDPLLVAIEAKIKSPEKKAEVYKRMKALVGPVKRRFEDRRLRGDFDSGSNIDSARFEQMRDLATMEAIAKALPPEIRGKVIGSFRKVAELKTTKARQRYMAELLPKIENALEGALKRNYRAAIRYQMKQGAIKVADSRTRGGKLGGLGHAVFEEAKAAIKMADDPAQQTDRKTAAEKAEARANELRNEMEGTPDLTDDQIAELDGKIAAVELLGNYGNADSARLEQALGFLNGVYAEGRGEWLTTLRTRRDWRNEQVAVVEAAMGRQGPATDAERTGAKEKAKSLLTKLDEGIMQAGLSGSQKIRRLAELTKDPSIVALTEDMEMAFLEAENAESDMNDADTKALTEAMRRIFGVTTEYGIAKKLKELTTSSVAPVEKIEGMKTDTVKVPIRFVESILAGEVDALEAGGEKFAQQMKDLDEYDLAQLEQAWEAFNELPQPDQARKRTLSFDRTTAAGTRQTVGSISQVEGLQQYLTMRQPDQAVKLARMGYDETTLAQLEAWLKPEVLAFGSWMVEHIGEEAFTIDSIHRAEKGVGLKLVDNYFPVRNDVAGADNRGLAINAAAVQHTGKSIGAIKERVANNAPPAYVNAIAVFLANRAQVNFWKSHVAPIREYGGIIRDERFATAVKLRMGETYYQGLNTMLKRIESGGALNAAKLLDAEKLLKSLTSSFALGVLGGRVSTLAVNVAAGLNVTLEIPANELAAGMAELFKRPEAFKDAFNSPAIQRRLKQGATPEAQLAKSEGLSTHPIISQLNSAARRGVMPINWVDTGANVFGAAIVWEHTRKEMLSAGMTEEEARAAADKKVTRVLLRAAQPTSRLAKSELELKVGESPLAALFTMFMSEPRKTMAILYMANRELITGKGTYGRPMAAQQVFTALLIFQTADFMIRSAYAALAKAADDEPEDFLERLGKRIFNPKAWGYALTTTHLRSVPIGGEVWNQWMAKAFEQKAFAGSPNILNNVTRTVMTFEKPETLEEAVDGGIDLLQGIGPVIPGGSVFAQGGNVMEFVSGVATSNGVSYSDEDRVKRIKGRFGKYRSALEKEQGPTKKEDGKIDKAIQERKQAGMIDRLRADLAPLTPEMRTKVLDAVNPSKAVRDGVTRLLEAEPPAAR